MHVDDNSVSFEDKDGNADVSEESKNVKDLDVSFDNLAIRYLVS